MKNNRNLLLSSVVYFLIASSSRLNPFLRRELAWHPQKCPQKVSQGDGRSTTTTARLTLDRRPSGGLRARSQPSFRLFVDTVESVSPIKHSSAYTWGFTRPPTPGNAICVARSSPMSTNSQHTFSITDACSLYMHSRKINKLSLILTTI